MNATAIIVGQVIDKAILLLLGDKVAAERQREISRTIQDAIDGKITDDEAIALLRHKDGDALDHALRRL